MVELACQFHTIIAYLYILMYKEIQHFGHRPFQIWKKNEQQILNLVDNASVGGKNRGPEEEKHRTA